MRNKVKQVLLITWTNCVTWIRSPRIWYVILIEAVFCFGAFYDQRAALNSMKWTINPFECFFHMASYQKLLTGTLFLIFISEIYHNLSEGSEDLSDSQALKECTSGAFSPDVF